MCAIPIDVEDAHKISRICATHCNTLQHTATHCNTLQHTATHRSLGYVWLDSFIYVTCCSVLQYVAVCCSVLQCVAVCCSVLQCVAVCCSTLQCDLTPLYMWRGCLMCVTWLIYTCATTSVYMWHVSFFHSVTWVFVYVTCHIHERVMSHTQKLESRVMTLTCITLQHTATHCNTLQHTATHRSLGYVWLTLDSQSLNKERQWLEWVTARDSDCSNRCLSLSLTRVIVSLYSLSPSLSLYSLTRVLVTLSSHSLPSLSLSLVTLSSHCLSLLTLSSLSLSTLSLSL